MTFGLFEASLAEELKGTDRKRLAEARYAQAFVDVESKVGSTLYSAPDRKEFDSRLSLVEKDIRRIASRHLKSESVVFSLKEELAKKFESFKRKADCWREDPKFLEFLLERAGTVDVTQADLVEYLEEYGGVGQEYEVKEELEDLEATKRIENFSTASEDDGVSANPLGLSEFLKFCADNNLDWSDPESIELYSKNADPDVDVEALYGWQETEVEERKEASRKSASWKRKETDYGEEYRLPQGEFDYLVSQTASGDFILMKVAPGTSGEREWHIKEVFGHFDTPEEAQSRIRSASFKKKSDVEYAVDGPYVEIYDYHTTLFEYEFDSPEQANDFVTRFKSKGYEDDPRFDKFSDDWDDFDEEGFVREVLGRRYHGNKKESRYLKRISVRRLASNGWHRDSKLDAFVSSTPQAFSCSCGRGVEVPSYTSCVCGKIWNAYRISSGEQEFYVAREVPRRDVVLAKKSSVKTGASVAEYLRQKGWTSDDTERVDADSPSGNVGYFHYDKVIKVWGDMGEELDEIDVSGKSDPEILEECLALEEEYRD